MSKNTKDLRAEDMSTMHKRPDEENPGKKKAYQKVNESPKDTKRGKVAQLYALLEEMNKKIRPLMRE